MKNASWMLACLFALTACSGEDGKAGAAGADGAEGATGADGSEGATGAEGALGSVGDARFTEQEGDDLLALQDAKGDLLDLLVDAQEEACNALVLDPPAAGEGVQYQMGGFFSEFYEGEQCMFIRVPEGGLAFNDQNIVYTAGSHHVLLWETPYDGETPPQFNVRGEQIDTANGNIFPCVDGAGADWEIGRVIGGSQNPEWDQDAMPADTAFVVEGGSWMIMNTHYLNPTPEGLHACVKLNYETIPVQDAQHNAQTMFYYMPVISVPGQATATASLECTIGHDITMMGAIQSHMHARGMDYKAELYDAQGALVRTLFETDDWETPSPEDYCDPADANCAAPYLEIPAGSTIKYTCSYNNGEDRDVYQGLKTTDEMCMFIAGFYVTNGDLTEDEAAEVRNCGVFGPASANGKLTYANATVPGAVAGPAYVDHFHDGGVFDEEVQELVATSCHATEIWAMGTCMRLEGSDCRASCEAGKLMDTYKGVCYGGCDPSGAQSACQAAEAPAAQARCSNNQSAYITNCVGFQGVDPNDGAAMTACITDHITECVTEAITACVTDTITPCITECVTDKVTDCSYDCMKNVSCATEWDAIEAAVACN